MSSQVRYVDIEPSFSVIRNFNELKSTLEGLVSSSASAAAERGNESGIHKDPNDGNAQDGGKSAKTPPRILCLWDVDDTLVSSGSFGVRQSPVFRDTDLRPLFKSMYGKARHLLLSQGSIDDVFEGDGSGRLRYLRDYFYKEYTNAKLAEERAKETKKKGVSSWFNCGGTEEKQPHTGVTNPSVIGKGSLLIRLSTIQGPVEGPEDTEFLSDSSLDVPPHFRVLPKKSESEAHWLVLRPSTHGISLASLNTLILPSKSTAFIDGKYFRKTDIAWSLAASGHWDTVFFIDNNLSELGIVKYGIHPKKLATYESSGQVHRFFEGDYLLLAMSAKLRELSAKHGRDVTSPEQGKDPFLTPNKASSGETDDADGSSSASPQPRSGDDVTKTNPNDDSNDNGKNEDQFDYTVTRRRSSFCPSCGQNCDDCACERLSLSSNDSTANRPNSNPPSSTCSPNGPGTTHRSVKLVIANLHIPQENFRRIVGGIYRPEKNAEGEKLMSKKQRTGYTAAVPKFRASSTFSGQPTFIGDVGVTDNDYDYLMQRFVEVKDSLLFKLEECVEQDGYVMLPPKGRRNPSPRYVSLALLKRPERIVNYSRFFSGVVSRVEKEVIDPIRTKKINESNNLYSVRGVANTLQHSLHKRCVFIDPYLTGDLAVALFNFYTAEGPLPKTSLKELQDGVHYITSCN